MGALVSLLAGLFKTIFVRLPLGIWLAVILCGAWVALERHYQADYPWLPCTIVWPVELVNPVYPHSPSRVPQLPQLIQQIGNLNVGIDAADLSFGEVGYGVFLGIAFGLVLAWPCGIWKTLRNYSGLLLFPIRVILLGLIYAGLFGAAGAWLASTYGSHLITSGYLAVFGLFMPILVPLPFWVLRPLFPSAARRQAVKLVNQAKHEASTSLAAVAKHDPTLGDVTKGKSQQEWNYYATVCGVFIGALLAEKRGVSRWRRNAVERQVRKRLNKLFDKGEHGLTAVMQFSREQLERKTKFTTEVIVGLWLAMQMKGDLNPQRDQQLASSLGAHLIQGMSGVWTANSRVGTVVGAMLLWTGVAGLAVVALEPEQFQQQLAQLGWKPEVPAAPAQPSAEGNENEQNKNENATADPSESTPASAEASAELSDNESSIPGAEAITESSDNADSPSPQSAPLPGEPNVDDLPMEESAEKIADGVSSPDVEQPTESSPKEELTAKPAPKASEPVARQWSHISGRTIQGVARSYWNGAVELERSDGKTAFVEIAQLSQEDRQEIYEQFATAMDAPNTLPGSLITRNWVAAASGRQVAAALVRVTAENVELLRADGKLFSIPLNQLSEADQAFAKEQLQAAPSQK